MDNKAMNTKETTEYNFKPVEERWSSQWENDEIYPEIDVSKPKFYCLDTWPYPSADGVHIGYVKSFGGMDVMARYKKMKGFNVLHPTGWDSLGLPAENYAIKAGRHPRDITLESIKNFKRQFNAFGLSFDWNREIDTADPDYYKWTQWVFLVMYKNGLAYRKKASVNWCPNDKTVLANEQVIDGNCERCGEKVIQKELMQWFFKVSEYKDRLYQDCSKLNWEDKYLNTHKRWLENVHDWSIARQRYWGPPIPIIYCDKCGTVPVPESDLPVILPYDVDFVPTGEPPLAIKEDFVNTKCPQCGGDAKREVDILDTFVSSAWYQFRFTDPHNKDELASKEAVNYWGNVDHYEGTIEHLTAHLVYARFVTKVLFDQKYLPFDEPFPKYTPVGLLVDKSGTKFSKRLGNAPDTNDLIEKYGGDLLRLSCFFITPFDDVSRWGEQDVIGVKKFRDRIWRVFQEKVDGNSYEMPDTVIKNLHQLIRNVEGNIESMKYNIALSKMMVFITDMVAYEGMIDKKVWEEFTKLFAPFAPFMAEEMWHEMGNNSSVHVSEWPVYDPKYIVKDELTISIQINGKVKGTIVIPAGSSQEEVETLIRGSEKFGQIIKDVNNVIFVENKTINFVLK